MVRTRSCGPTPTSAACRGEVAHPGRRQTGCDRYWHRRVVDQTAEIIAFQAVIFPFLAHLPHLALQFRDALRGLPLLLFPPLTESGRGSGVALAFLVSHFRRSLHVNRYLYGTLVRVKRHELVGTLPERARHRSVGRFGGEAKRNVRPPRPSPVRRCTHGSVVGSGRRRRHRHRRLYRR